MRLRKLVAFDRVIARLVAAAPDRWILKGAVALHFRAGLRFRSTMDLDLGRYDDERAATTDLLRAQSIDLGDFFRFAVQRTSKLDALEDAAAIRYHITTEVDRRPFEFVTLDIGFSTPRTLEPDVLRGPDLLSFANIPAAEAPTLPLEQHVAEKVHAYTRIYVGGRGSTRVKDLVDLAVIPTFFSFEAGRVQQALRHTFSIRTTHPLPDRLPAPPSYWSTPYSRMAVEVGLDPELSKGYEEARAFLDALLAGTVHDQAMWDPAQRKW